MPTKKDKAVVKEENVVIIKIPIYFMYYFCSTYYMLIKHDEVILRTKYCRGVMEKIVDWISRDMKLTTIVDRGVTGDNEVWVKVRIIGAVR